MLFNLSAHQDFDLVPFINIHQEQIVLIMQSKEIMVFRPTMEEFMNFSQYIKYMESQGAHRIGLAKVIPPAEWKPRSGTYEVLFRPDYDKVLITSPSQQIIDGERGVYTFYNVEVPELTVNAFKEMAEGPEFMSKIIGSDHGEVERAFWNSLCLKPAIYGADVQGTLYDPDVKSWNINNLCSLLDLVKQDLKVHIQGVNSAYLYFGMWKAAFPWHTEDMDLYSINYLHYGYPKYWYVVPPSEGYRLDMLATGLYPNKAAKCAAFMRHKDTMISPRILKNNNITVYRAVHEANEFMITFPYAYHSGFNGGFNIAESTNFAVERWIDFGKNARLCNCDRDSVRINMDVFVKRFQPEQYDLWRRQIAKSILQSQAKKEIQKKKSRRNLEIHKKVPMGTLLKETESSHSVYPSTSASSTGAGGSRKETTSRSSRPHQFGDSKHVDTVGHVVSKRTNSGVSEFHRTIGDRERKEALLEIKTEECLPDPFPDQLDDSHVTGGSSSTIDIISSPSGSESSQNGAKRSRATSIDSLESVELPAILYLNRPSPQKFDSAKKASLGSWSRGLENLWQFDVSNFAAEQQFNRLRSLKEPHCSICQYFIPKHDNDDDDDDDCLRESDSDLVVSCSSESSDSSLKEVKLERGIDWENVIKTTESRRLLLEACFKRNPVIESTSGSHSEPLLHCTMCGLCVHPFCYSLDNLVVAEKGDNWKCLRCYNQSELTSGFIQCHMCALRGGALMPNDEYKFAFVHVICALLSYQSQCFVPYSGGFQHRIRKIRFKESTGSAEAECIFCHQVSQNLVRCHSQDCEHQFHATCAYECGCVFELRSWPKLISVICNQHDTAGNSVVEAYGPDGPCRVVTELWPGKLVLALRTDNNQWDLGMVEKVIDADFCVVDFDDGSYSNNLFPQDLISCDCTAIKTVNSGSKVKHQHSPGASVEVRWTDGDLYKAKFRHEYKANTLAVCFTDGHRSGCCLANETVTEQFQYPDWVAKSLSKLAKSKQIREMWGTGTLLQSKVGKKLHELCFTSGSCSDHNNAHVASVNTSKKAKLEY